jgi:hypothetical protein
MASDEQNWAEQSPLRASKHMGFLVTLACFIYA